MIFCSRLGARKNEEEVAKELVRMVRDLIGPIAAFKTAVAIRGLPRTRSGKIARKSISDLAKNKYVKVTFLIFEWVDLAN